MPFSSVANAASTSLDSNGRKMSRLVSIVARTDHYPPCDAQANSALNFLSTYASRCRWVQSVGCQEFFREHSYICCLPMIRKAGIQSQVSLSLQARPTSSASVGRHHNSNPLFWKTKSFGSRHAFDVLEIGSLPFISSLNWPA